MTRQSVKQRALSVAENRAAAWVLYPLGLGTFGVSLYLIVTEPATDKWHIGKHAGLMAVALLLLPGVFKYMISNASAGVELYAQWKAARKNGASAQVECPNCHKALDVCVCAE